MTFATQITIFRILLIPVFIGVSISYGESVADGQADDRLRWLAIGIFALAALSDAVDGYIARNFNQHSRLGAILDPLADKLLLLSAIITLSFTSWHQRFPLWFPLLVIFRDLASIGGAFLVDHIAGKFQIQTHWTGKVATFAQIAAVLWLMLDISTPSLLWPTIVAGVFTAISGFTNLANGIRQIQASGHGDAHP